MDDPVNLAEGLLVQQRRCREILAAAETIGPPGAFLRTMLKASLERSERAVAEGDVIRMMRAYHDLSTYKE